MREYVQRLNSGEAKESIEAERWAKICCDAETWQTIDEVQGEFGLGPSDAVAMLAKFYRENRK
jgi:hypothetical protein